MTKFTLSFGERVKLYYCGSKMTLKSDCQIKKVYQYDVLVLGLFSPGPFPPVFFPPVSPHLVFSIPVFSTPVLSTPVLSS